jgi:hypothetical protein
MAGAAVAMNEMPPITDSPWFWAMVYSAVPLVALALLSGKYAARQSQLERQYQGRQRMADGAASETAPAETNALAGDAEAESRPFSSPDDTLISLIPLVAIFALCAIGSAVMLYRERRRLGHGRSAAPEVGTMPP